ncbi:hypothetical protein CO168_03340 [Candidatus Shapirobacteria bacterium CG_4_9_14_3_um_filter_36_12]|uniref:AbiEi antitoxin C-terminal domain-containing protein n=6 Tax=Candidatus Shapironibacteriota TaxID=1752721 RepID=A0A1J5HQ24_9BACT|nr:MAG: hypothetical protein AUK05_01785 [Candidatus Shapirobacteria bacterium CG2_30_35_20]PIX68063.1 MAG: hypothetical protein COZ41_01710 [Candidatus Shapirobacteria bacterium CG_4_10_14_3_um_filter_35_13]PJA50773.1 MAG: hypothetical protein CO168_03340 [Candidatus Shapirobacteria bacterium CG_4_9_14_3_um_filter_36_12]PJE66819.1 MAG: hypothetical protein COU93_02195 [Candidatus Shapirobacteria bacterium CG10_big_fil_rev_8_21_14_0_10_36_6]
MQKGNYLMTILKSPKTVFTLEDIAMLWQLPNTNSTMVRLSYYAKNGDLMRVRRGVYVKNKQYNKTELATRIYAPSYVSFETVLAQNGLIFQFQSKIQIASYLGREVEIDGQIYLYKKIKDAILANSIGVNNVNETSVATCERAFLDTLYINDDYHFDNLRSINWNKVFDILPIYNNLRMTKIVNQLFEQSKI